MLEVLAQLTAPLLLMLDGLLHAGDLRAQRVIGGLHLVKSIGAIAVLHPVLFYRRVDLLVLCVHRLKLYFQLTNRLAGL